jgi:hypothetical protein
MVQMKHLKEVCKTLKLVVNKGTAKEELLVQLGRHVFKTKTIILKEEDGQISFKNLQLTSKVK